MIQGLCTFPGIDAVLSATYSLQHGISPGVCTIECKPQGNFASEGGDLVFDYGGTRLVFPQCKVDSHSFRFTESGQIWSLQILDRRWKWVDFKEISGHYNVRLDTFAILKSTEKTPQDLARFCLQAMGEGNYDVSQLPNDTRPEVHWEAENPAQALQKLVEPLGCRVVLGIDNAVRICLVGQGGTLPSESILTASIGINPPEKPDSIKVVCGKTRFQADFVLEAVGLDLDGTIRPINELSYKPTNGWENESPGHYLGVKLLLALRNPEYARELAKATVFRWYRITLNDIRRSIVHLPGFGFLGAPYTVHGCPWPIHSLLQVLPIEDVQVATYGDAALDPDDFRPPGQPPGQQAPEPPKINDPDDLIRLDFSRKSLKAMVWGQWWTGSAKYGNSSDENNAPVMDPKYETKAIYYYPFTINKELGIVEFQKYVVKLEDRSTGEGGGKKFKPADLKLRCAVSVREKGSLTWHRHGKTQSLGGRWGTGPKIVQRDEIVLNRRAVFSSRYFDDYAIKDNRDEVDKESDYYLRGAALHYQTTTPEEVHYVGILPLNPDGAIQSVTWSVSNTNGATTTAARNDEFTFTQGLPSYRERRLLEKLRQSHLNQAFAEVDKKRAEK